MIIRYNMHGFLSRTLTGDLFADTAYVTVMTFAIISAFITNRPSRNNWLTT